MSTAVAKRTLPLKSLVGAAFAVLWVCCLLRFAVLFPLTGRRFLSGGIADFHLVLLGSTPVADLLLYRQFAWVDLMSCCVGWAVWDHPRMARDGLYAAWVAVSCVAQVYRAFKPPSRAVEMAYAMVVVLAAWNLMRVVDQFWQLWGLRLVCLVGLPLTLVSNAPKTKHKSE